MSPATSPQQPIAVAIVDDNRLVRDALAALLGRIADFRIEAARVADDDSLKVAAALSRGFPSTKIVMMDLIPVHDDIVQFVNAGVSGFVLKDATFDEFVATIRSVAAGDKVLPPRMTESLFSQIVRSAATAAPAEVLDDV